MRAKAGRKARDPKGKLAALIGVRLLSVAPSHMVSLGLNVAQWHKVRGIPDL